MTSCIDIKEVQKWAHEIFFMTNQLKQMQLLSCDLRKSVEHVDAMYDFLLYPDIAPTYIINDIIEAIHQFYYNLKSVNLTRGDPDAESIIRRTQNYKNNMFIIRKVRSNECATCGIIFTYRNKQLVCPDCNGIGKRIVKFHENSNSEEVKQSKTNITKHYTEIMQKIYGVAPKKNMLPVEVINKVKKIFVKKGIHIEQSTHYVFAMREGLQSAGFVTHDGKKYDIKKYKNQANYIIKEMYPELKIPALNINESSLLLDIFMTISATFQQMNPGKYAINYPYIIFRTLFMLMHDSPRVKELLKFIYIQKENSFRSKDRKLQEVNSRVKIFKPFLITPLDIYHNGMYYK